MSIMAQLQEPFDPIDIEWRVGSTNQDKTKGIALAYVTNRAIQNRLDALFGPFGWRNEFREWKGTSQLCGISIKHEGEWITKWDGADDSQTEAVKGGLSDAMKRAGYQWGIGRYLYNLEDQWVPLEPMGRSYKLKEEPKLPQWALPDGYQYPTGGMKPPRETTETHSQTRSQSSQSNHTPNTQTSSTGQNRTTYSINHKSRVINLKTEMKWDWDALGSFASDVLKRSIKKVITDIKSEEEWKQVEDAMLITKNAS